MITEDYVSYNTAKLLKEKGFDVPDYYCSRVYSDKGTLQGVESVRFNGIKYISAPTLQMAMKWLREMHDLFIGVEYVNILGLGYVYQSTIYRFGDDNICCLYDKSYEKSIEAAIKYCLENLI